MRFSAGTVMVATWRSCYPLPIAFLTTRENLDMLHSQSPSLFPGRNSVSLDTLPTMGTWKPTEVEMVKELATRGVSAQRIGVRIRRTAKAVLNLANELGIPVKSKIEERTSMGLAERWRGLGSSRAWRE